MAWAEAAAKTANQTQDFWIEVMRELIAQRQSKFVLPTHDL